MTISSPQEVNKFFQKDEIGKYLGVELLEIGPGRAVVRMKIQNVHLNPYGGVHGGVIFALADLAFGLAGNSEGIPAVAINATISYMKSIQKGTLYAEAQEYASNPRLASYTVYIRDDRGEQIALFQGMAYRKIHNPWEKDGTDPDI
jgi:acyl-CoA thioesterase